MKSYCHPRVRFIDATLICLCLVAGTSVEFAWGQAPPPANYGNSEAGGFGPPQFSGSALNTQPSARIASVQSTGASVSQSATGVLPQDPAALGGPSDPSGTSAKSSIPFGNVISMIREGGVLMFPIVLSSIVLLVFVLERLLFLRRGRIIPRPFVRGVIEQLEQQQLDRGEAIELCEENGSPIAELFIAALKKWGRPAVEVEQAILDAGERVTSELRKYLRLFNAISNLTPLLGLLGTVLGMIDAFNAIASEDAMGRPEMLASGIGAALLTTAAGLCVAIPAYAAYAFFVGRTDRLTLEMDALGQNIVELISAEAMQSTGKARSRSRKAA